MEDKSSSDLYYSESLNCEMTLIYQLNINQILTIDCSCQRKPCPKHLILTHYFWMQMMQTVVNLCSTGMMQYSKIIFWAFLFYFWNDLHFEGYPFTCLDMDCRAFLIKV